MGVWNGIKVMIKFRENERDKEILCLELISQLRCSLRGGIGATQNSNIGHSKNVFNTVTGRIIPLFKKILVQKSSLAVSKQHKFEYMYVI